jgi:hypothetical protein
MSIKKHSLTGIKYDTGERVLRVQSVRNNGRCIMKDEEGNQYKISYEDLEKYKKIPPVGIMTFFEADIGHGQRDVIVTLHRICDLNKEIRIPYIGARQTIVNMFSAPLARDIYEVPLGLCFSNMTCPPNVDFSIIMDCKRVISTQVISVYMDDTIEDMINLITHINFDNIIKAFKKKWDPEDKKNVGKDLYSFLDNNGFMNEFGNAFNIVSLDGELTEGNIIRTLMKKYSCQIEILGIVPYTYEVDLDRVDDRTQYVFVRNDIYNKKIWVVKYVRGQSVLFVPRNQKEHVQELLDRINR